MEILQQDIRREFETKNYFDFKGLTYEVKETRSGVLRTEIPTFVRQKGPSLYVNVNAPTLIEGGLGELVVNAHAPVMIRNTQGKLTAYLSGNSVISSAGGDVDIISSPYLELLATNLRSYNNNPTKNVAREDAPAGNWGLVIVRGCKGNLNFRYKTGQR